jgi:DNA repair protein SbcC/Rad50
LKKLEEELKEQNGKLAESREKEEQLRKLQELMEKKAEAEKLWKRLQESEPEFQTLERKIIRYEQCVVRFKYLLDSLNENRKRQEEREKQILTDTEKLRSEEAEIEQLGKMLNEIKPAFEKRAELMKKADELMWLLQLKALQETILKEEVRLNKGIEVLNGTVQQFEKLKTEKQQLERTIKEERGKIPDLALLSKIKAWYIEKHNIDKLLLETGKEIEKFMQQENEIRKEVSQILMNPVFEKFPPGAGYDVCIQHLKSEADKIKEKQKTLVEQESHFRVKARLKAYAEELEDGKPCPLCGSLNHPVLFKSEDIREETERLHAEQNALEQMTEQISSLGNRLSLLDDRQQLIRRNQKASDEKKKEQQQRLKAHTELFVWGQYQDEKELDGAFSEAKHIQAELNEHEMALENLSKNLELEEKNRERYQTELEKIDKLLTVHQTELKTKADQLQLIQPEHYHHTPVELIEEERKNLLTEHERIERVFTENSNLLQEKTRQKDMLNAALAANRRELEQDVLTTEKLLKLMDEELRTSSFHSIDEVAGILSEPFDAEAEKKRLAQYKDQLLRSKSLLEQLQNETGERIYDAELHENLRKEMELLKEQITQKNQEQGKTAELLKKLQKDLKTRVLLQEELEKLEIRAENIRTMKSLFKASGFVNYVSSVYLQNLCNAANDRFFRLTRQKLSLEITPDNNFQVRDFLNGGKVRSVKTLSGGQTFQAALSLALALADNIQKITESNQNFFFLDEGFGSLDKESLGIVFDTLKTLRKENRIVGVISHVEEMQQEIDVHLRIENQEEKGSIIHSSRGN